MSLRLLYLQYLELFDFWRSHYSLNDLFIHYGQRQGVKTS